MKLHIKFEIEVCSQTYNVSHALNVGVHFHGGKCKVSHLFTTPLRQHRDSWRHKTSSLQHFGPSHIDISKKRNQLQLTPCLVYESEQSYTNSFFQYPTNYTFIHLIFPFDCVELLPKCRKQRETEWNAGRPFTACLTAIEAALGKCRGLSRCTSPCGRVMSLVAAKRDNISNIRVSRRRASREIDRWTHINTPLDVAALFVDDVVRWNTKSRRKILSHLPHRFELKFNIIVVPATSKIVIN